MDDQRTLYRKLARNMFRCKQMFRCDQTELIEQNLRSGIIQRTGA